MRAFEPLEGGGVCTWYFPCDECGADDPSADDAATLGGPIKGLTKNSLRTLLSHIIGKGQTHATSSELLQMQGKKPFTHETYYGMLRIIAPIVLAVLATGIELARDVVRERPHGQFGSVRRAFVAMDCGWAKGSKKNRAGDSHYALVVLVDVISNLILAYDMLTNLEHGSKSVVDRLAEVTINTDRQADIES